MKRLLIRLALVLAWSCGGKAVVDPPGDSTTTSTSSTGTGGTTSTSSSGTTSTSSGTGGTTTTTTTTTTPMTECEWACTELFMCGLEIDPNGQQLCPGFAPEDLNLFLYGSEAMACVPACQNMPALTALINPDDCPTTVQTIMGASADFACACDFGPGSPECG